MSRILRIVVLFLYSFLLIIGITNNALSEEKSYSEEYVKSLYIVRLSHFVYWQHNPKVHDVCVVGSDELGATLVQIAANLKLTEKLNIKEKNLVSNFSECEILYISKYSEFELSQILFKTRPYPILTVSDTSDFIKRGGLVSFNMLEDSISININNSVAKQRDLEIDSRLLEIAKKVF